MNANGNGIDQLTRQLMQSSIEKPSADLAGKIMRRVGSLRPYGRKESPIVVHIKSIKTWPLVVVAIGVYAALLGGALYLLQSPPEGAQLHSFLQVIKERLPYILTIIAIIIAFPFFATLDRALAR